MENKLVSNKGVIIATLFVGVLSAAIALFIHFDGDDEGLATKDTKNEQVKDEGNKTKPSPSLNFAKVFVTPIDTKMPSLFFVEILNSGTAPAINFKLNIDFGESKADSCEFIPEGLAVSNSKNESPIKIVTISKLEKKQSIYVVCATNSPLFKSITVGGGNVEYDKQLTYEGYKDQLNGESISFYEGLLRVILGAIAGIFLFYFFFRLMGTL